MTNYRLTPLQDTAAQRKRIIEQARKKMQRSSEKTTLKKRPIIVIALAFLLTLFLAGSYIQQAIFNKIDYSIEKVIIPNVPYDSLITSTYIDETNEFIYNTATGFYAYDVEEKKVTLLVDTTEIGRIYDYGASEDWLVWEQPVNNKSKIHVLNRHTKNLEILEINYSFGIELQGDTIVYTSLGDGKAYYKKYNLQNAANEPIHELSGEGSRSRPAIDRSKLAISELSAKETVVNVYDFSENKLLNSVAFPYKYIETLSLKGSKLYGYAWEEGKQAVIGEIDLTTGEFQKLKTIERIDGFATDGRHFAIAVQKGDSNSVQLFSLQDQELKRISKLSTIKERLVKPRFTKQGTLIVNGEGKDLAMYVIKFE